MHPEHIGAEGRTLSGRNPHWLASQADSKQCFARSHCRILKIGWPEVHPTGLLSLCQLITWRCSI